LYTWKYKTPTISFQTTTNGQSSLVIYLSHSNEQNEYIENEIISKFDDFEYTDTHYIKTYNTNYVDAFRQFLKKDYSIINDIVSKDNCILDKRQTILSDKDYSDYINATLIKYKNVISDEDYDRYNFFKYTDHKIIIDELVSYIKHDLFSLISSPMYHFKTDEKTYSFNIIKKYINTKDNTINEYHIGEYNEFEIGYDLITKEYYILYDNNGHTFDNVNKTTIKKIFIHEVQQ
jgi:hypothetical protein